LAFSGEWFAIGAITGIFVGMVLISLVIILGDD
jgi:hypothetical protein